MFQLQTVQFNGMNISYIYIFREKPSFGLYFVKNLTSIKPDQVELSIVYSIGSSLTN